MIALGRVWKLYFIYTILLVVGIALAGFVLEAQVKKSLTEHLEEDSLTLAKVMAQSLPDSEDSSVLDQFCDSFRNVAGARITLLDRDGKVVGESDADTVEVGPKLDRPEVQEAVKKGVGTSIRFSKTLRIDMLYTAFFSKEKGKIIRLAVPMTKVRAFQNEVMILFSLALFLVPFFAIIITFFFTKYGIYEENKKPSISLHDTGAISRSEYHAH
jgi:two-component system, OmpR family, phosphate regulon sensor histidine kinase PhoR